MAREKSRCWEALLVGWEGKGEGRGEEVSVSRECRVRKRRRPSWVERSTECCAVRGDGVVGGGERRGRRQ